MLKVEIGGATYSIVGVVANHLADLKSDNNESNAYRLAKPDHYQILIVRTAAGSLVDTKNYIEHEWEETISWQAVAYQSPKRPPLR